MVAVVYNLLPTSAGAGGSLVLSKLFLATMCSLSVCVVCAVCVFGMYQFLVPIPGSALAQEVKPLSF